MGKRNNHLSRTGQPQPIQVTQSKIWSSPLPPPEDLALYPEDVRSEILNQFKLESEHRRSVEIQVMQLNHKEADSKSSSIKYAHRYRRSALFFSWSLILSLAGMAVYLLVNGYGVGAFFTGLCSLGFLWVVKPSKH